MAGLNALLRDRVDHSGKSKTSFAKSVGLSRTSLFHILRGTSLPKRATLNRFLQQLDLDEQSATEINHCYETERLNTIRSSRKEVRSAQDLFKASLLASLRPASACRLGEKGLPDFWVTVKHGEDVPVLAEMNIIDPFSVLGRAQLVRSLSGQLDSRVWKGWVCVSAFEPIYKKYQEDFAPFNLHIVTPDSLVKALGETLQKDSGAEVSEEEVFLDHVYINIETD